VLETWGEKVVKLGSTKEKGLGDRKVTAGAGKGGENGRVRDDQPKQTSVGWNCRNGVVPTSTHKSWDQAKEELGVQSNSGEANCKKPTKEGPKTKKKIRAGSNLTPEREGTSDQIRSKRTTPQAKICLTHNGSGVREGD